MNKILIQKTTQLWKTKLIVFSGFLILLLIIGSSVAMAEDDSQNPRLASNDPDFAQYQGMKLPLNRNLPWMDIKLALHLNQ